MDFLKSVLASLVAVGICGFWPGTRWIAEQCIEAAARKLPETHKEPMREEWYAELDAYPSGFWTLCWAVDLVRGAAILAREMDSNEWQKQSNIENNDYSQKILSLSIEHKAVLKQLYDASNGLAPHQRHYLRDRMHELEREIHRLNFPREKQCK